jgi:predicted transglutaminase-like protease
MTITPEYVANWIRKKFVKNHPYCESGIEISKNGAVISIRSYYGDNIKITIENGSHD